MVKPLGPNHCINRARSIHAFQTRVRDASNVREMTNSRTAVLLLGGFSVAFMVFQSVSFSSFHLYNEQSHPFRTILRKEFFPSLSASIPSLHPMGRRWPNPG